MVPGVRTWTCAFLLMFCFSDALQRKLIWFSCMRFRSLVCATLMQVRRPDPAWPRKLSRQPKHVLRSICRQRGCMHFPPPSPCDICCGQQHSTWAMMKIINSTVHLPLNRYYHVHESVSMSTSQPFCVGIGYACFWRAMEVLRIDLVHTWKDRRHQASVKWLHLVLRFHHPRTQLSTQQMSSRLRSAGTTGSCSCLVSATKICMLVFLVQNRRWSLTCRHADVLFLMSPSAVFP